MDPNVAVASTVTAGSSHPCTWTPSSSSLLVYQLLWRDITALCSADAIVTVAVEFILWTDTALLVHHALVNVEIFHLHPSSVVGA